MLLRVSCVVGLLLPLTPTPLPQGERGRGEGRRFDSCDRCPACVQIGADTHPDYFQAGLPPDKHEWPIDMMRELLRAFSLKSARGKGKVAVLDDADDFNEESANAFLKTLEEPPPGAVLILIGTSAEVQLDTIVSRCRVVRFDPLSPPELAAVLLEQRVTTDPAEANRLAECASGFAGRLRTIFRRAIPESLPPTSTTTAEPDLPMDQLT